MKNRNTSYQVPQGALLRGVSVVKSQNGMAHEPCVSNRFSNGRAGEDASWDTFLHSAFFFCLTPAKYDLGDLTIKLITHITINSQ